MCNAQNRSLQKSRTELNKQIDLDRRGSSRLLGSQLNYTQRLCQKPCLVNIGISLDHSCKNWTRHCYEILENGCIAKVKTTSITTENSISMGAGNRPVRPVSPSSGILAVGWIRPAALNPVNAFGSLQEYKLAEHGSRRRAKRGCGEKRERPVHYLFMFWFEFDNYHVLYYSGLLPSCRCRAACLSPYDCGEYPLQKLDESNISTTVLNNGD